MIYCYRCKIHLTNENWWPGYRKKNFRRCKACSKALHDDWVNRNRERVREFSRKFYAKHLDAVKKSASQWHKEHIDRVRELQRKRRHDLREQAILELGGCCACCGETKKEFLAIDHINGGGRKHAKTGYLPRLVKQLNYSKNLFRILCHNCNHAFGQFGYCPHHLISK